jgi:hypothetical protein
MLETGVYVVGKYSWWPVLRYLGVVTQDGEAAQFCMICVSAGLFDLLGWVLPTYLGEHESSNFSSFHDSIFFLVV